MQERILFVVNPMAGREEDRDIDSLILDFLARNKVVGKLFHTTGKNDKAKIKKTIKKYNPTLVVACGGDGTLNMVGSLLVHSNIRMALIPMGSANGLATSLGIPRQITKALNHVLSDKIIKIDALLFNKEHYAFHLGDLGFNARVIQRFEQGGIRGLIGYFKHFIRELKEIRSFRVGIEDEKGIARNLKSTMVVFANAEAYGTGAKINPTGSMKDGEMEVIVIKPMHALKILSTLISVLFGKIHSSTHVKVFRGKKFIIENKSRQPVHFDGELLPKLRKITVEVIPQCLTLVVSKD